MKINNYNPVPYEKFKKEILKDPEVKRLYDELEEEFALAEAVISKRIQRGLTQKQLAEKIGTKQSAIARLEGGEYNPSFKFLRRVAAALDTKVKISF